MNIIASINTKCEIKKTIHVVTCVTKNHIGYCNVLFRSMKENESGKTNVKYFYMYSGEVGEMPNDGEMIGSWIPSKDIPRHGSLYHGLTLNHFVEHHKHTSDITIIVDADVAIVYKGWDEVVVNELKNVDAFGAEYLQRKRYRGFPCIFFFATHTKNISKDLDFTPMLKKTLRRVSCGEVDRGIFGISRIGKDTGWKLPEYFYKLNLNGKVLECHHSNILKESKKHNKISEMWYYDEKLFGSHFAAGMYYSVYGREFRNWYKMLFGEVY